MTLQDLKKTTAAVMEWVRPAGIVAAMFLAKFRGGDAAAEFHILGPLLVVIMSGSVAFESLVLGEAASEKVGYAPNRAYQIQSGLNNLATAFTAVLVYVLNWGRFADATIVTVMLVFFVLSATNHVMSAVRAHNLKPVNLMRPLMTALLLFVLVPPMIKALSLP